jgi:hypothetical protein
MPLKLLKKEYLRNLLSIVDVGENSQDFGL